jgi:hypothetical protein
MAKQQAGALSALKVKPMYGEAIEEDDDVDEAMRRVMDAYTARQQRNYDPSLMAIGQGLLASRGNFGEAVGMASKSYEDMQSKLRQEEIDTSAANLQLAQSRRDQALMRQKSKATAGLFGGTSGEGASDDYGDQDAVSFLVANGMPRKEAVNLLVQEGVRPSQKLSETGIGMDAMKRYAKYVTTYGNDENAKALMEMMKLQNQQFTYQNGVRVNNLTGKAEYVQPEGLPPAGAKDIELFMGDGTYKVDSRTAKLYEFANNQGPEVAQAFVKAYKEKGTVPKDIVDKYNAQQSGGKAPAGGEEFSPERLNSTLTALEMKSPAFASPVALSGEQPPLQKGVKFNQDEAKVMASMFRIGNAKSVEELSPFDFQVFAALQAKAKPPVELAAPSEVEKAAAAPAAIKVAAAAPPAPAAVAPPKAAAVAPAAPPAKAAVSAAAAPSAAGRPAPPTIFSPTPLPLNPSAEAKLKYETDKAAADAKTRADVERYKIEMEQYNKDLNRPKDVEAGAEEATLKKRGELAEVDEQTFVKALDTSRQIKSASLRVMKNVIQNPNAIGLLADPGLFNAVASLVSDGLSLGNTTVKLTDAEGALAKVMPYMTKQDLQSRSEVAKDLAEIELLYRREFLAGLGTVTDSEGRVVQRLGGTPSDNPTVLIRRMELITSKAKYKEDKVKAFRKWRANKNNKSLSINDWLASDEAIRMDENYDKTTDALYDKFFGAPATKTSEGAAVVPQLKNAKEALLESLRKK